MCVSVYAGGRPGSYYEIFLKSSIGVHSILFSFPLAKGLLYCSVCVVLVYAIFLLLSRSHALLFVRVELRFVSSSVM